MMLRPLALALAAAALAACAGAPARPAAVTHAAAAPPRRVQGEEFRVVGRPGGDGDAYDATLLFDRATQAVRERRCVPAVEDYERLVREFPDSRLVPTAYFNRGVCLQALRRFDDAVQSYRETIARSRDRELVRDAWFRIAAVAEAAEPQRPDLAIEATTALLAMPGLTIGEQLEAHARQAVAVLAQGDRPRATAIAQRAVSLAPTAEAIRALDDDTYIAQAYFVIAEATRLDAAAIAIDVNAPDLDRAIERRVSLVMHAHVQFNDTIRVGNPHWAAASGYRLGEMYGELYNAIVNARVPEDWDANAVAIYRRRTSQRLRPLLTGALRAWEATLAMARRNGIADNEWVRRTDQQIEALREMVLNRGTSPASDSAARRGGG